MKERIMFVDDDFRVLAGLRRALGAQAEAWDMEFVNTAEKAEESLKIRPFDLLKVDRERSCCASRALRAHVT